MIKISVPKIPKRKTSGFSLLEMVVSMGIFLVILGLTYYAWGAAGQNADNLEENVAAIQNAKNAADSIQLDVMMASYIFAGRNIMLKTHTYQLPAVGDPANELLLAIPESSNTGSVTYTLVGYYLVKHNSAKDPANPNAYKLIRQEVNGITPATADSPPTINFNAIAPNRVNERIVADYIDVNSFVLGNDTSLVQATISTMLKIKTTSRLEKASFDISVNLRNK